MDKIRLFVLGDSISMHYGPYLKQMLGPRFEYSRKGENEFVQNLDVVSDINGGDSSCVLEFLQGIIKSGFQTDYLLLNCGLHDTKTIPDSGEIQIPVEDYKRNLETVVELVKNADWRLIWVRTTPVDDDQHNKRDIKFHRFNRDVKAYNKIADAVMQDAAIPGIDLNGFTLRLDEELYCDHVHFKDPVRKLQGAYIAGHLEAMV